MDNPQIQKALEKITQLASKVEGSKITLKSYHAAVILHLPSKRMIASGTNVNLTMKQTNYKCLFIHTEMAVIRHMKRSIMIVAYIVNNSFAYSNIPCKDCEKVLKRWKITVYYTE